MSGRLATKPTAAQVAAAQHRNEQGQVEKNPLVPSHSGQDRQIQAQSMRAANQQLQVVLAEQRYLMRRCKQLFRNEYRALRMSYGKTTEVSIIPHGSAFSVTYFSRRFVVFPSAPSKHGACGESAGAAADC